jgi:hypothetical protein
MALADILIEHIRTPHSTRVYIDMSKLPPVETRPEDLLTALLAVEIEL